MALDNQHKEQHLSDLLSDLKRNTVDTGIVVRYTYENNTYTISTSEHGDVLCKPPVWGGDNGGVVNGMYVFLPVNSIVVVYLPKNEATGYIIAGGYGSAARSYGDFNREPFSVSMLRSRQTSFNPDVLIEGSNSGLMIKDSEAKLFSLLVNRQKGAYVQTIPDSGIEMHTGNVRAYLDNTNKKMSILLFSRAKSWFSLDKEHKDDTPETFFELSNTDDSKYSLVLGSNRFDDEERTSNKSATLQAKSSFSISTTRKGSVVTISTINHETKTQQKIELDPDNGTKILAEKMNSGERYKVELSTKNDMFSIEGKQAKFSMDFKTGSITIKANSIKLDALDVTLGKNNIPVNNLPNCLFTGAPHYTDPTIKT